MPRRKKVHPIVRQIKRRLSEIASLKRTARMLGIDLSELEPVVLSPDMKRAKRKTRKELQQQVQDAFAPLPPLPAAPAPEPPKRRRCPADELAPMLPN